MAEVMAGFFCGYGLALVATPLAGLAIVRARATNPTVARTVPEGTSLVAISIILHAFFFMTMTAVGILLGLMLSGLEESRPAGGLGSPNRIFTGFIILSAVIAVVPLAVVMPRQRRLLLAVGLLFAGIFGWLMPYLSLLGPEG